MTGPTFACPERFVRRVEELISGDGPSIRQRRLNDDRVVYSTYDVMRNALYWPTMSSIYSAHSRVLSGKYGDELRPLVKEVLFDGYVKETPCMDATGLVRLLSVINPSENEASLGVYYTIFTRRDPGPWGGMTYPVQSCLSRSVPVLGEPPRGGGARLESWSPEAV